MKLYYEGSIVSQPSTSPRPRPYLSVVEPEPNMKIARLSSVELKLLTLWLAAGARVVYGSQRDLATGRHAPSGS